MAALEVFLTMLRLGCLAFGGPVAHLALFQQELVERRGWIDRERYPDLIAFCQFLPGPASSQVGMGLGLRRAGLPGLFAAWAGFTLPSAALLIALAAGVASWGEGLGQGWLQGLHCAVVAIVAWAVWGMARTLCPDRLRGGIALVTAVAMLVVPLPAMQFAVIGFGAGCGLLLLRGVVGSESVATSAGGPCLGRRLLLLAAWTLGIVGLALLGAQLWPHRLWLLFLACFRVGFLVFGGGHVVLPMLEAEMVDPGWLSQEQFLTGYALTQAMPGPIFTLSAYLGAAMQGGWLAIPSALVALLGIFGPSFLLVAILLPAWDSLRGYAPARAALAGVAAAVVGLLLAALFFPIASSAIKPASAPLDCALALAAFGLLALARWPAWLVVILAALAGGLLYREGLPATGWG